MTPSVWQKGAKNSVVLSFVQRILSSSAKASCLAIPNKLSLASENSNPALSSWSVRLPSRLSNSTPLLLWHKIKMTTPFYELKLPLASMAPYTQSTKSEVR